MTIAKRLEQIFLVKYSEKNVFTWKRAVALMYVDISMVLLLVLIFILYPLLGGKDIASAYLAISAMVIIYSTSLFILRSGKYYFSANLITIASALVVIAGFYGKLAYEPYTAYTTFIYFMFMVIAISALFSTKWVIHVVCISFIISNIVYFNIIRSMLDPEILAVIKVALLESSFAIFFTYIISIMIMRINKAAVTSAETEAVISKEQYANLQNLLIVLKDTIVELTGSSENISGLAEAASDNSRSQSASAEQILATTEEVSAGMDSISSNTNQQDNELIAFSDMLKVLINTINNIRGKINNTMALTESIKLVAGQGERSLSEMSTSMEKIDSSSKEVTNIVMIINDISDRINLLSLNAAIEAARAGDAGRGFAVVADEISKLADQTATSIKDIDTLIRINYTEIESGMKTVQDTVDSISEIVEGVTSISSMIDEIFEHMKEQKEINDDVNNVVDNIKNRSNELKNSVGEQTIAVNEILKTIEEINRITQSNSDGAEQMLGYTDNLTGLAQKLDEMVSPI